MSRRSDGVRMPNGKYKPYRCGHGVAAKRRATWLKALRWARTDRNLAVQMFGREVFYGNAACS